VAVMNSLDRAGVTDQGPGVAELERLCGFRGELYRCLGRRADELFELTEALLCAEGPVQTLVGLCLTPEHRRGHGALYDGLNCATVDADRLREVLAAQPVLRMFGNRIVLAVDAGHQSATMTLDLYGHLLNDQLDEVADAMDAARAAEASARRPAATVAALPTGRSAGRPVG